MRAPYGLEIIENCVSCPHHQERLFCNLPEPALKRLSEITSPSSYPRGATLFVEGQSPRGVFIMCSGSVKLTTSSIDGRTLIVRISEPGELLGLPATVTGKPYELTAEVLDPAQANFIPRSDFLKFLMENGEVALRVAQQLGETYHAAVVGMRSIGLAQSAAEKLARFLLERCPDPGDAANPTRIVLTLTHEEIAQTIGTSRETVSRLFSEFKRKQLLQVKGSVLILLDRLSLQRVAGTE